jgi:hypothetical protein
VARQKVRQNTEAGIEAEDDDVRAVRELVGLLTSVAERASGVDNRYQRTPS